MRATQFDPRILLAALAAAFVFLLATAGTPLQLPDVDLFSSSGGTAAVHDATAAQPAGPPAWVQDPLASPLHELQRPVR